MTCVQHASLVAWEARPTEGRRRKIWPGEHSSSSSILTDESLSRKSRCSLGSSKTERRMPSKRKAAATASEERREQRKQERENPSAEKVCRAGSAGPEAGRMPTSPMALEITSSDLSTDHSAEEARLRKNPGMLSRFLERRRRAQRRLDRRLSRRLCARN